jgi:hypothetical protein
VTAKRKSVSLEQVGTQETDLKLSYYLKLSQAIFQHSIPAITFLENVEPWGFLAIILWAEVMR